MPEELPELRDEVLERGRSRAGRVLAPERVDQPIGRDRAPRVEQEQREQGALLRASELHERCLGTHLERTEQPELQQEGDRAAVDLSRNASPLQEDRARSMRCQRDKLRAISEPLAGRDRAVWTSLDGGRMATNTHIPVRSARRCIVRPAVSKFLFATAVAVATSSALAFSGALKAGPELAQADLVGRSPGCLGRELRLPGQAFRPASTSSARTSAIRACSSTARRPGHAAARERELLVPPGRRHHRRHGRAVYPVIDGTVTLVTAEEVRVELGRRARVRVLAHPPARPRRAEGHRAADRSRPRQGAVQPCSPDRVRGGSAWSTHSCPAASPRTTTRRRRRYGAIIASPDGLRP